MRPVFLRGTSMAADHNALRRSGPGQLRALDKRIGTNGLSRSLGRLAWVRYKIRVLSNLVTRLAARSLSA